MSRSFAINFAVSSVLTIAALVFANITSAQSPEVYSTSTGPFHQPVSPYPVEMGFSQHHSSTAAEGFQRGRAALIQALGNYQLSTSQAEIMWQQARSLDRENDLKQTVALHTQQKMWMDARVQARKDREARIAEGRQQLAERQATVYSRAYQLSSDELNASTGAITWPVALRSEKHEQDRARLEELFRQHVAYGKPQAGTANEIAKAIDLLSRSLRGDISSMSRDEYVASQKFLRGLKYAATTLG